MKKKILLLLTVLAGVLNAHADNGVAVGEATVPQGGSGIISIALNNEDYTFTAFTFKLTLPEGISFVLDEEGKPTFTKGERFDDHGISSSVDGQTATFGCLSLSSAPISGTSGVLLTVNVKGDVSLNVGTKLDATLSELTFTTPGEQEVEFSDVAFDITVGENRILLDETSTTMPQAETNANVRVLRTIKANEWSTLCLPFDMSEEQVKDAFGEDVELKDFAGYEVTEDADEVVGINVLFSPLSAIEANHPCLIKVSEAVSEFTVDGVDIAPEAEPVVATVKRTRRAWSELIGTYVAQTEVPEKTLFLSGGDFWYSAGKTKMKAFRAYFDFYDVLTEMDENYANVRFVFNGGEATGVKGVGEGVANRATGVYTLQGVKMDGTKTLPKGVYVVNGKKVAVDK